MAGRVYQAKLAEQAERYREMADFMRGVCKDKKDELTVSGMDGCGGEHFALLGALGALFVFSLAFAATYSRARAAVSCRAALHVS